MPRKVFSKLLVPAAAIIAESYDIKACKRSELPIYVPETKKATPTEIPQDQSSGVIEDSIRTVRQSITSVYKQVQEYENKGMEYVNKGIADTEWLINYLGQEDNVAPKGPAIAIGGLTGLILGLRGGFFRKVIFTTAGAAGMASICYPKEASEYSKIAMSESKTYATIAYNFVYGETAEPVVSAVEQTEEFSLGDFENDSLTPDPSLIVSQMHKEATHKDCHCPIGACLNHREEKDNYPASMPRSPASKADCDK